MERKRDRFSSLRKQKPQTVGPGLKIVCKSEYFNYKSLIYSTFRRLQGIPVEHLIPFLTFLDGIK